MERWREVAAKQWGVIGRDQLGLSADAIWRLIKRQELIEVLPAVYRVAGSAQTWQQDLMAAVLWGGPGTVASYRSAAALWGFDGYREGPLEISTSRQKQFSGRFRVHRTKVAPAFVTERFGVPVTNAHRTLQDVVTVVDDERGNQLFDELLRKGFTSMDSVRRFVDRAECSGRPGTGILRRMVEERSPDYQPSASKLQGFVRRILIREEIPFVEEYEVYDAEGNFVGRADFKILDCPMVVEVEGREDHTSKLDFDRDLKRRNALVAAGLAVVHVTWTMARHHEQEFVDELQRVRADQLRRLA